MEKCMVKNGQYEILTSPPTKAVACPHATFTLSLSRSTGMYSENYLYSKYRRCYQPNL